MRLVDGCKFLLEFLSLQSIRHFSSVKKYLSATCLISWLLLFVVSCQSREIMISFVCYKLSETVFV